jgi:hypothetical protein
MILRDKATIYVVPLILSIDQINRARGSQTKLPDIQAVKDMLALRDKNSHVRSV